MDQVIAEHFQSEKFFCYSRIQEIRLPLTVSDKIISCAGQNVYYQCFSNHVYLDFFRMTGIMINGKPTGRWIFSTFEGKVFEMTINNKLLNGPLIQFSKEGKILKLINFQDGNETSHGDWNSNGDLCPTKIPPSGMILIVIQPYLSNEQLNRYQSTYRLIE